MNTPEMNHSGSIVAWTIGWAASGDPISPETAYAMQANETVATSTVQATASSAPGDIPTPKKTFAITSRIVDITAVTTTVDSACPAISSAGGTGVARRRLSTPVSRRVATETTSPA